MKGISAGMRCAGAAGMLISTRYTAAYTPMRITSRVRSGSRAVRTAVSVGGVDGVAVDAVVVDGVATDAAGVDGSDAVVTEAAAMSRAVWAVVVGVDAGVGADMSGSVDAEPLIAPSRLPCRWFFPSAFHRAS